MKKESIDNNILAHRSGIASIIRCLHQIRRHVICGETKNNVKKIM